MGVSPFATGQTSPNWEITVNDDTGAAVNITGATLTLTIRNTVNGQDTAGAGTWSITNGAAGQATYTWGANDSATAGNYLLIVKITLSGGGVLFADGVPWQVNQV